MFRPNWYQCADGSWKPYDYGMDDGPRRWHSEDAEPSEGQSKVESKAFMDTGKTVQVDRDILEGWRTSARMYVNQLDGFLDGMRMEDVKVPCCVSETRKFMASLIEDIASVQNRHETFRTMGEKDDVGSLSPCPRQPTGGPTMTGHHNILWRVVHRDGSEWTEDELRDYVDGDALSGALSETGPLKFSIDPTGCLYVHDMYGRYLCLGREMGWNDFRIEFTSH